jgi:peptidoglycan-associated lipoprotein
MNPVLALPCPGRRWLLAGCADNVKLDDHPAPVETARPRRWAATTTAAPQCRCHRQAGTGAPVPQSPEGGHGQIWLPPAGGSAARPGHGAQRMVYFDFDSFVIKDEFKRPGRRPRQGAGGQRASAHGGRRPHRRTRRPRIQPGAGPEACRGRGQVAGAAGRGQDKQVEAVSFGEERPAARAATKPPGPSNRRAELKDREMKRDGAPWRRQRCKAGVAAPGLAPRCLAAPTPACSTTKRRARPSSTCATASCGGRAGQGPRHRACGAEHAAHRAADGAAPQPAGPEQPARSPCVAKWPSCVAPTSSWRATWPTAEAQKDVGQALDDRLRKLEPVKVSRSTARSSWSSPTRSAARRRHGRHPHRRLRQGRRSCWPQLPARLRPAAPTRIRRASGWAMRCTASATTRKRSTLPRPS